MKRIFLLILLLVLISISVPAFAQQEISFEVVQVQFWPEYDQPTMLVIYTIELPADIQLPVDVTILIPADVGEPNAVAVAQGDQLLTAEYTREMTGEWAEIVVVADTNLVHIEYYDPGLSFDNFDRAYDFSWNGRYATSDLIVRVQIPVGAVNMDFSEDMGSPQAASDGLSYYLRGFGPMEAGEKFDFSMSYQKSSSTLTLDALIDENSPVNAPTNEQSGLFSSTPSWLWYLIGFGAILMAAGVWVLIKGSTKSSKSKKNSYKQKKRSSAKARANKKPARYCHQCGTAAYVDDKFCRECGQKLRV